MAENSLKVILISLVMLIALALILKGFFAFQQTQVCTPKVLTAIERFFGVVSRSTYEGLQKDSLFADQQEFNKLKSNINQKYAVEIKDWWWAGQAATIVKFEDGRLYALLLRPENDSILICIGEYIVETVRGELRER